MEEIKKAVKKTVGRKKAMRLIEAAEESIGADYGEEAARLKLRLMLEELELLEKQTEELERQMSDALHQTDYADFLLSIKGIGVATLAACLGELGDPTRIEASRQMSRMAGYNLAEDSSGKNKSGAKISQKGLRQVPEWLGIPMSNIVGMFLRLMVLQRGQGGILIKADRKPGLRDGLQQSLLLGRINPYLG